MRVMGTTTEYRVDGSLRILWLLVALVMPGTAAAGAWETVLEENGLRVQQRPYEGSPLLEVRGEIQVSASLNAIMALLKDADYNHEWVHRSRGATILEESGYVQAYVYGIVNAPWPIQDRDTVVRFDYVQDPETREIVIDFTNFPDLVPEEPGLVRVPDIGGFWRLRPLHDGRVDIVYQVHGNPGGWVPTWIANYAAVMSVSETLRKLPQAVQRYAGARSEFVRELGEE